MRIQPIRRLEKNTVKVENNLPTQRFSCLHFDLNFFFRVQIKQGENILTDSENIYNTALTGGRLGMFVFGQHDVIWSRLEVRCSDRYATLIGCFPQKQNVRRQFSILNCGIFLVSSSGSSFPCCIRKAAF